MSPNVAFFENLCYNTMIKEKGDKNMLMLVGDTLEMKKKHPCGETFFTVMRVGSDIKIRCNTCAREVTVARVKIEKGIRKVLTPSGDERK